MGQPIKVALLNNIGNGENNMTIEFNQQRVIFQNQLSKVFDYIELEEVHNARLRMYQAGKILDEDLMTFMMFASHAGNLLRLAYYKYVHKQGFDVRALADASVIMYMFHSVYEFNFESALNQEEIKEALNKTRYPKWTKLGLIGGSTKDLAKLGNEFSEYMDGLKELEATA